jgi:hypothetical protein
MRRTRQQQQHRHNNNSNLALIQPTVINPSVATTNTNTNRPGTTRASESSRGLEFVGDKVLVQYRTDWNITALDRYIKSKLGSKTDELAKLQAQLEQIDQRLQTAGSISIITMLELEKGTLKHRMATMESQTELDRYLRDTQNYLVAYHQLPAEQRLLNTTNNFEQEHITPAERQRESIVDQYLSVAARYIGLQIHKELQRLQTPECNICGANLWDVRPTQLGVRICPSPYCRAENKLICYTNASSSEYKVLANLEKTFKRLTCQAEVKLNIQVVMEDLDSHYAALRAANPKLTERDGALYPGAHYRALTPNAYGRKSGTCQYLLCDALSELGYSSFYKDYMYIAYHYWGWLIPPVHNFWPAIVENFSHKQEIWDRMSIAERGGSQSSISTEYRLCRELQHAGAKVYLFMFKVSTRPETIKEYDEKYELLCRRAGYTFPHIEEISE